MIVDAQRSAVAQATPLAWLGSLLREELAPYPGRGALVARMVIAATIVMLITMIFRIPYGAYGAIFALTITRESPETTVEAVKVLVVGFAAAVAIVLLGAIIVSGEPILRLVWVLCVFFLIFFALSAMSNSGAAARFGYLIIITTPLWDQHVSSEKKVESTLWAIVVMSFATIITAVIEIVYARLQPIDVVTVSLIERLEGTASLLRSISADISDSASESNVERLSMLGTSRMRRDLQRSGYSRGYVQQMGAVVALVGRLVDLASTVPQILGNPSPASRTQMKRLASHLQTMVDYLLGNSITLPRPIQGTTDNADIVPLLSEMELTTALIIETLSGAEAPDYLALIQKDEPHHKLFLPDAFSNPDHIRFAIGGGLAACTCYLVYNLIDWAGISTAVTTCFLTALTTVGASRQKQVLRFSGAIVGGILLGFGAQMFVLPAMDSITGFLLLFIAVSIVGAWFATASPRVSYFGNQMTIAFYLINLEEFRFQTSLVVARDRVVGILLGLSAMWLIFDKLAGRTAAMAMKNTFVSTLRLMGKLMQEPVTSDRREGIERTYTLRETINSNFEKLRQLADGVALEFGPSRDRDLALRRQLLGWQLRLRLLFLARVNLLKYRLRLPGFELPASVDNLQKTFDARIAGIFAAMADRVDGRADHVDENAEVLLLQLERAVSEYQFEQSDYSTENRMQTFLSLSRRIIEIARSLDQEMEYIEVAEQTHA
jgi:multidrug resistance protein MdtO